MKKFIALILIFLFFIAPVSAKDIVKTRALINTDFNINDVKEKVELITYEPVEIKSVAIPIGSTIEALVINYQKELRWHKSGYIICKLLSYEINNEKQNVEDEIYFFLKRYEKIQGKDAAITTTELITTTAVDVLLPGVSVAYFFTKGAIQREKHPNWFKSGVSNAYDNSICWFWLKGRPIYTNAGDFVNVKEIKKTKACKLDKKIEKRRNKETLIAEKKELKKQTRLVNKTKNLQKKLAKKAEAESAAAAKIEE